MIDKNLYKGVKDFLNLISKKKELIKNNPSITDEEIENKVLYNNKKLSELDLYFTFPGYNEVELKEGGSDILLTMKNVEEYVKLVSGVIDYSLGVYCQSLCMAFAKVSEIIAMAYNEFIDYPRSYRDVFIKGFSDAAKDLYSSMLTRILQIRVSFIDIMPKTPEEMLERTIRYFNESMKLNQYVGEIANEKAKVDETLLKNLQLLNKFIEDASRGRDDGKNKNVRK